MPNFNPLAQLIYWHASFRFILLQINCCLLALTKMYS